MLYRVVLIFPDTENLAGFVEHIETSGEVFGNDYTFVGNLTEEQVSFARRHFQAYVRLVRAIE